MKKQLLSASGYKSTALFAAILVANGCVEPFVPEFAGYQGALVVESNVTDRPGPYEILLSRSRPLDSDITIQETGATVSVIGPEGQSFRFDEVSAGRYLSDSSEWKGEIGGVYQLDIVTAAGKHYLSAPDTLKFTPPIDSIYYEAQNRVSAGEEGLSGIAIFVDTHDPYKSSLYYKYDWIESWEIKVEWPLVAHLWKCYDSDTTKTIFLANSASLTEDRVSKFEINFVSTQGFRLKSMYSMLVQQRVLDKNAYNYWAEVKKLNETLGTLFDPQPYQVQGNIFNVDDPEEVVLGYFDAVSFSEKRFFVFFEELRELTYPPKTCWWIYELYPDPENLPQGCIDCTYHGGSLTKPDFWPR